MLINLLKDKKSVFIARQLSSLIESGNNYTEAKSKLSDLLSDDDRSKLDTIDSIITDYQVSGDPKETITKIFGAAKAENCKMASVFAHLNKVLSWNTISNKIYWTEIGSNMLYSLAVLVIAFVVYGIFCEFIFPQFLEITPSFGAELPAFPFLIYNNSSTIYTILNILMLILLVTPVIFILSVKKDINNFSLVRNKIFKMAFKRFFRAYDKYLLTSYIYVLHKSGVKITRAIEIAVSCTHGSLSNKGMATIISKFDEIRIASEVGNFDNEVKMQIDVCKDEMVQTLVSYGNSFSIISKSFLYTLVGSIVIAMYLPIFSLGSVV